MSDAMHPKGVVVESRGVSKAYRRSTAGGGEVIPVIAGLDLAVQGGETVAIQGASGIGKTTILNVLGGLDRPDSGEILFRGEPLPQGAAERARWRSTRVGFIFQFHGLLAEFRAAENVALAGMIAGQRRSDALDRSREILSRLGLAERVEHYPDELSGGEQQRVSIARALVTRPALVLADEPTGDLDPRTGDAVVGHLLEQQNELGFALVVATHSERLAARCHRCLEVRDGRLVPAAPLQADPDGAPFPLGARHD